MSAVVHIAGPDIKLGPLLRQRCGWCGEILIDYNLERIAVPVGQDPTPGTWPAGELVAVDGDVSYFVAHIDGDPLPAGSCSAVEPGARPGSNGHG